MGAALQADGENEVRVYGLKHQKEKRSMDHFAGLDVFHNCTNMNCRTMPEASGAAGFMLCSYFTECEVVLWTV